MVSPGSDRTDMETLLAAVGQLWCAGVELDLTAFSRGERRRRVPLPTYPFERVPHALDSTCMVGPDTVRSLSLKVWQQVDSSARETLPGGSATSWQGMSQHDDHVARTLASLFRELLGVRNVRPNDNFFDLGGNSLVSVKLRARIQERLNVSLPVHAFLEFRTFAALAERIREAMRADSRAPMSAPAARSLSPMSAPAARSLSPMSAPAAHSLAPTSAYATQRSGSIAGTKRRHASRQLLVRFQAGAPDNTPLFLIQPIGGTVYTYEPFVQRLNDELPVYGVRASGMEPNEPIFTDIPTIAARYLEEIMTLRPEGPYFLGGHSAGGVIAYEMAQQLLAHGHNVPLVLMMDTGSLPVERTIPFAGVADVTREMSEFEVIGSQGYRSFMAALQDDTPFRAIVLSTWQALMGYKPCSTQASILYLRAREQVGARHADALDYWMDLAHGPFAFHKVPGNHFTMMAPPHVAFAAQVLQQHLPPVNRSRITLTGARDGLEMKRQRVRYSGPESVPESSGSH
jgi:thioesterase domain-containing protein/acyl carrier protein